MEEQIIACLLEGLTNAETASKCGIAKRTVQRKLSEPQFISKYSAAKNSVLDGTINRLRSSGPVGVEALREVAWNKASPAAARVSVGRGIVELLLRAVEIQDFGERLTELEKMVATEDK